MSITDLDNDQLASHIRDGLLEAESRLVADGGHPRALKAVKLAHGILDVAADHLIGDDVIQPFSGGTPKGP